MEGLEDYRKAGKIASSAREFGKDLIKPGVSLLEAADKIEEKIFSLNGELAFPTQISLNEVAAHYCPSFEDKLAFKEGDLVKLDIGVHVNGYVGDTACTIDLGDNEKLVEASQKALENAIAVIKPGIRLGEIGKTIQETIESFGFKPVRNLSGHGIGKFIIHGPPSIPNFDTGDSTELTDGQLIAIEPFASTGAGMIEEKGEAEIFHLTGKKPVRNMFTRQILKKIDTYNELPFAKRWLVKEFSLPKVSFAFRELEQLGILKKYPPLPDRNNGLISQAEHSILVAENPEILTL